MSQDTTPLAPNNPDPAHILATGETVAERHLAAELRQTRQQLRWTQIGSLALSLLTLGYLTYLTTSLTRTLEPKAAAEVAQGIVQQQVEARAQDLASDLKQRLPKMVADFPDYAKAQVPQYRARLEQQIDTDLNRYLSQHSGELDKLVDETLEENRETIGSLLKDAKDPALAQEIGNDLQQKLMQTMNETSVGGESLQTKLGSALTTLTELEKRMAKLASNRNLSPEEKKARRAIALLASSIESKNPAEVNLMRSATFDQALPIRAAEETTAPNSASQSPRSTAPARSL